MKAVMTWLSPQRRNRKAYWLIGLLSSVLALNAQATENPFDALLEQVTSYNAKELADNDLRLKAFRQTVSEQQQRLEEARQALLTLKGQNQKLSDTVDANEQSLAAQETALHLKSGDLGEMFGVVRQVAGEVQASLNQSLVSAQYPERADSLATLAHSKVLPNTDQLNAFWQLMLREAGETGMTRQFLSQVVQPDGTSLEQTVTRVGAYSAIAQGHYLMFEPDTLQLKVLPVQPAHRFREAGEEFASHATGDIAPIMIDPTRGQLLRLLTLKPGLWQRVEQGGVIGYCILALGLTGALLGLVRFLMLNSVNRRINRQLKTMDNPQPNNPLGRILLAFNRNDSLDFPAREAALEEAVAAEVPMLERWNGLIKLLAAVAPLLGLLGTVIGMILTFQSITLFGTSDPKLMAGGISTALVTTVLGLTVAIPLLFAHALLNARSRRLFDLVEHQSLGLIAREQAIRVTP